MIYNNIALIPLRGGSKSIPKKNIKLLAGIPLCNWVIKAALSSSLIDSVYVSTECDEISSLVSNSFKEVNIIKRPLSLASDNSTTESVMINFMENVSFDNLITLQATSPLLSSDDLDAAIKLFLSQKFDSLLTAVRVKRFFWNNDNQPLNYDPLDRPRRQDFKGSFMENGAFYITKRSILQQYKCRLGGKIGIYEMNDATSVEIDEPDDWKLVENIINNVFDK